MDHVSSWMQAALLPETWDVAGVACRSLTVWHAFVLAQTANPYVMGEAPDRDAATALLLYCSRDHAAGRDLFLKPHYRRRAARRVARAVRRAAWIDVDAAVCDYLSTCLRVPQHKAPPKSTRPGEASVTRPVAAPVAYALIQFLSAGNPAGIEAAWNTPYALARCLFDAHRDIEGKAETLESLDEERRFDEWNAKQQEAAS